MPTLSSPPGIEKPKSGQGSGGVHPPGYGGGGDHSPGDGSSDYGRRLNRAKLGLLLGMFSISALFVGFTAFSFLRSAGFVTDPRTGAQVFEWLPAELPLRLLLLNTVVLLLSSVSMELARRSLAREMILEPVRAIPGIALEPEYGVPWLPITIVLGVLFLSGQWLAWNSVEAHGLRVSGLRLSPFFYFYLLTALHAVHLLGGIITLLYCAIISCLHRPLEKRRIVLEIAAWYWHFMGLLWVYIFALLAFGRSS